MRFGASRMIFWGSNQLAVIVNNSFCRICTRRALRRLAGETDYHPRRLGRRPPRGHSPIPLRRTPRQGRPQTTPQRNPATHRKRLATVVLVGAYVSLPYHGLASIVPFSRKQGLLSPLKIAENSDLDTSRHCSYHSPRFSTQVFSHFESLRGVRRWLLTRLALRVLPAVAKISFCRLP